ncbi:YeeE/YedE family protein [Candidatus Pelagibacter ubique]|nr:YeeE/YedE family protein [Candidatus Pelagibacter ubique]
MGGGCTSGHGISGIGRFSLRSIIATVIFMIVGILTVLVKNLI